MKFSQAKNMTLFAPRILILLICAGVMAISVSAQKEPLAGTGRFEQCRNGPLTAPAGCVTSGGTTGWVNANGDDTNSHYSETHFIPYRLLFSGMSTSGSHTVVIGYDILKSGRHPIDYLGSFNATETTADPCSGVAGCVLASPTSTIPVPIDTLTVTAFTNPNTGQQISQVPGVFTMWGGSLTSAAYLPYGGGDERRIQITFTANVSDPVLSWGGHLAWIGDWGFGNTARGLPGSPYAMRFLNLDGLPISEELTMADRVVFPSGAVFIKKEVFTFNGGNSSTRAFPFTATPNFGPTAFSLVDDNAGPGNDYQASMAIDALDDAYTINVTEGTVPGWLLVNVNCVENFTQDSTKNGSGPSATINVQEGEVVTCTFQNSQLTPSSAPAEVSGRILTSFGRGISGARLTITNPTTGAVRTALSNPFGYYRFVDLPTGEFYFMNVRSKRYTFLNDSQSFTLNDNITGLNFIANP